MGNRGSRTQEEQETRPQSTRPNAVYAQYPPAPPSRPPQYTPTPYTPPNNGQYYGGWHQQPPPYPSSPPPLYNNNSMSHRPYPHAPYSGRQQSSQPSSHRRQQQQPPVIPPAPTQELSQTATIRNAVNLKKNTLKVTPLPHDPSKLSITFTFDASAPCAVTTFIAATEEPAKNCKIVPSLQPPGPPLHYDKGLGHVFPLASASEDSKSKHSIHTTLYTDAPTLLTTAATSERETYPVIIRLEVVSEKGLKSGRTLSELNPGDEQKEWIQSQSTFAQLYRDDDGAWNIRVLKQKIWVEGVSYELQEIYGLEQASGTGRGGAGDSSQSTTGGSTTLEESEERLCVICLVSARDTTVLPCRHMCMCHECAKELRKQSSKCPICRNHVESLLHIRITKENRNGGVEGGEEEKKEGGESGVAVSS